MIQAIFVSPHIGKYGAERSLVALLAGLKEQDILPTLIIPKEGDICELLNSYEINYMCVPFKNWINIENGEQKLKGSVKLFINEYLAYHVAKKYKDQHVAFVHSNSIITSFGIQLARKLKTKYIQHIREFGDKDFNMCFDLGKERTMRYIEKYASKVICVSDELKKHYEQYFSENQCVCVYNGVPVNKNIVIEKRLDQNFKMVIVGRLTKEKKHIDVFKALYSLKEQGYDCITLDCYGDGAEKQNLNKYVIEHGLENNIHFMGFCNDVPLTNYQVGLMLSTSEAFGRVTVEYMLSGLPVIGAESGGTKEIVESGRTGILFPPGNVELLIDAIKSLYNNRDQAYEMGRNGYERALEKFSEDAYINNVMSVYKECKIIRS